MWDIKESLLNNQINELSKGEKANTTPNKYNIWSKRKIEESDIPTQPPRVEKPTKNALNTIKENKSLNSSPISKDTVP
jgi:hypothetical protein